MSRRSSLLLTLLAAVPWQQAQARPAAGGNMQVMQQVQQYQAIQQQMYRNQPGRKHSDTGNADRESTSPRKPASTSGKGVGKKTASTARKPVTSRSGKKPAAGRTQPNFGNQVSTRSSSSGATTNRTPTVRKRTPVKPTAAAAGHDE